MLYHSWMVDLLFVQFIFVQRFFVQYISNKPNLIGLDRNSLDEKALNENWAHDISHIPQCEHAYFGPFQKTYLFYFRTLYNCRTTFLVQVMYYNEVLQLMYYIKKFQITYYVVHYSLWPYFVFLEFWNST